MTFLPTVLAIARVPAAVREVILLVVGLAPDLRDAIAALIRALQGDDGEEERRAYEAVRRAAFRARQRR